MTEMIASEHFFYQELNDTQRAAWDKIYKTLINSTGHEDITENEAMIAVFRGKNKSLAEAKTEFYKLGFSFDEVDAIFLRLSDPNVLIIKPFHMPQEFGNEDFLSHLPYHAEDINESRQNPIVLFRGLSSFFQNTNATQQELETFTRWIADHFTFAPFWGKNEHGVDWGYSYMQMWAKSKIATHSISPQTDLVFLVGEDQKAYVVIKIPRLNKEVLYSFSDLIGNLDTYIQQESLLPGKPCPKVKYYNLTTNASKTEIEKTSWQKDEYEDIPPSPDSMQ